MGKQTARLVCREWKNVVDNRLVDMDVRLSNRTLEYVEKIDPNRRIRRLMVDKLSKPIKTSTRNRSSLPKNVKILQFVTDEFCTDTCCTPVGVMSIPNASYSRRGTSEANIRELLRVYRDIEVLVVEEMALKNVRSSGVLKKLQLNHLTTLEVSFGIANYKFLRSIGCGISKSFVLVGILLLFVLVPGTDNAGCS
jgi:hypothetical protein